jgi:hypothetical protein
MILSKQKKMYNICFTLYKAYVILKLSSGDGGIHTINFVKEN